MKIVCQLLHVQMKIIILNRLNFNLFRKTLIEKGFNFMILHSTEKKYLVYPKTPNDFAKIAVFSSFWYNNLGKINLFCKKQDKWKYGNILHIN